MAKKFFRKAGFISDQESGQIIGSWWRISNRYGFFTKSVALQRVLTDLRRNGIQPSYEEEGFRRRIPFGRIPQMQMAQILGAAGFSMVEQLPTQEIPSESIFIKPRTTVGDRTTFKDSMRFYIARVSDWRLIGKIGFYASAVIWDVDDSKLKPLLSKWESSGITVFRPPVGSTSKRLVEDGHLELSKVVPLSEVSWHEVDRMLSNVGYTLIPSGVVEVWEVFKEEISV